MKRILARLTAQAYERLATPAKDLDRALKRYAESQGLTPHQALNALAELNPALRLNRTMKRSRAREKRRNR